MGLVSEGLKGDRPGRATVTRRPARVGPGLRVRVLRGGGPAARRPDRAGWRGPGPPGSGPTARAAGRGGRAAAGRRGQEMQQLAPADAICVGAGVAVCGMVRRDDGLVRLGPATGWVDEPIGAALASELGIDVPVTVGNVADVAAFAEHARVWRRVATTSSTSTATSAWAPASSPVGVG
ncbi:hypothetical protein NKG94_41295 [Micromonospora sp. M12]